MAKDKSKDLKINPNQSAEAKAKALATAIGQIEKQFGKGAVMRLGQNQAMNVGFVPTGSLTLDLALGIGGLPREEL